MRTKQLTIRGFDPALERRLHELARNEGISLNKAALLLLRRGAGLSQPKQSPNVVGSSLDEFIGSWSASQERELLEAIEVFERIDERLWR
jgi:hypothetical protein